VATAVSTVVTYVQHRVDAITRRWRGFTMTPAGLRLLRDLRRQLLEPPAHLRPTEQPETVRAVA
jgi:hypothetical protein